MGFSPGDFQDETREAPLHWEGKSKAIVLWNSDESSMLLRLNVKEARKALRQFSLLVDMLEANGL